MQHEDLRAKKRKLKELGESVASMNFENYKSQLEKVSKAICFELKDHIFKENYILYPTALETINDDSLWSGMKNKCDEIGYCTFTPVECL